MALKCEKITQKWPKRAKGCALSKPRQYFNGEPRKKELIFLQQKNLLVGNRTRDLCVISFYITNLATKV